MKLASIAITATTIGTYCNSAIITVAVVITLFFAMRAYRV